MIPDEQISIPLLGGPDAQQVSCANLSAITEEKWSVSTGWATSTMHHGPEYRLQT
jgi:hypothetical protein